MSYDEVQQRRPYYQGQGGRQPQQQYGSFLQEDNIGRILKLRGLPYSITKEEIQDFFENYDVSKSDVWVEEKYGRRTGFAFVFFPDEETAQRARIEKHKQNIGKRYVEVIEAGFKDMQ